MFRNLIPALSQRYHVIAPDYPGFGQSASPDHTKFSYTFAHYADLIDGLLSQLGAQKYVLYVMDYGAPVGFRLALKHPERVKAIIVQNGNAYNEGFTDFWNPIKAYWADGSSEHRDALRGLIQPATPIFRYTDGMNDILRIDPDNWVLDQALLDRPGNVDIQLDLFYDYRTNVALYPRFQDYFRKWQPPMKVLWGANDKSFSPDTPSLYKKDIPSAETHLFDSGHFAFEDKGDELIPLIQDFLYRKINQ
jgi:pimeloyl-ACP methyl ester carboxylesterase